MPVEPVSPPRIARALLALGLLAIGCGGDATTSKPTRDVIRIERAGGQTGMEGGCFYVEPPGAAEFTQADLRALIDTPQVTTIAHWPLQQGTRADEHPRDTIEMEVSVVSHGEAATSTACGGLLDQEVTLTLGFEAAALDVEVDGTLTAFGTTLAVFQNLHLEPAVAVRLGLPEASAEQPYFNLTLAFTDDGVRGELETGGGGSCGVAVFPEDHRCENWRAEIDVDGSVHGVRPRDGLDALGELGVLPIQWQDGSTTDLLVTVIGEPEFVCGGFWGAALPAEEQQLNLASRVHIRTDDGRLDAELPADISFEVVPPLAVELGRREVAGWNGEVGLWAGALLPLELVTEEGSVNGLELSEAALVEVALRVWLLADSPPLVEVDIAGRPLAADAPTPTRPIDLTRPGTGWDCYMDSTPIERARTPQ